MKKMEETMDENIALGDSQALEKQTESNILPRVSEIEAKRGREATSAFNNGNFTECLDILKKLLETRHDDHRVQSNMAICQYLINKDDDKRTEKIIDDMKNIYRGLVDTNGGPLESDQEIEHCVLIYNLSLNAMELQNFGGAQKILTKLYKSFFPLSPTVGGAPSTAATPTANDLSFNKEQIIPLLISLNLQLKLHNKALNLLGDAEIKAKSDHDEEAQRRLVLCRALALVQAKAYKVFKRDLKPNGLNGEEQVTYEFLRANLEFVKSNPRKAVKLLGLGIQQMNSLKMDKDYIRSLYQNNLACLHMVMKKPNLGVFYNSQALETHLKAVKEIQPSVPHFYQKMKQEKIIYNLACNLLHAGQPASAFETFLSLTLNEIRTAPNYWLRLAECCINQNRKDHHIVTRLFCSPSWCEIKKRISANDKYKSVSLTSELVELLAVANNHLSPALNYDFASKCLKFAEILVNIQIQNNGPEPIISPPAGAGNSAPSSATSSPTKTPSTSRSQLLLLAIWTNLAYVSLCQNKFKLAQESSEKVLQTSNIPCGYRSLAQVYSASAHAGLNQIPEALAMLDPNKADMNFSDQDPNSDLNSANLLAKSIFQINVIVAHVLRRDLDRAEDLLDKMVQNGAQPELSGKILSLRIFVALSKGNVGKGRELAMKHTGIFVPGF